MALRCKGPSVEILPRVERNPEAAYLRPHGRGVVGGTVWGASAAGAPRAGLVPGATGGALWAAPQLHRRGGAGGEDALYRPGRQAGEGARDDAFRVCWRRWSRTILR